MERFEPCLCRCQFGMLCCMCGASLTLFACALLVFG
jgi:hypothetical protein